MPFFDATPMPKTGPVSGPIMSAVLQKSGEGFKVRISINKIAQDLYFGGSLVDQKLMIQVGSDEDEGRILIRRHAAGAFTAKEFMKRGGVSIFVVAWPNLPRAPREKGPIEFVSSNGGDVVLQLPSWARPDGKGGKLEAAKSTGISTAAARGKQIARQNAARG